MRKILLIAFLFLGISCSIKQKSEKLVSFNGITIGLPLADSLKSKYEFRFDSTDVTFVGPNGNSCDSIYNYAHSNVLKGINGKSISLFGSFYGHPKDGRIYKIYAASITSGYELFELFKAKYGDPINLRNSYNLEYFSFKSMDGVWELNDKYKTVLLYKMSDSHIIPGTSEINCRMYFVYFSRELSKDVGFYANQKEILKKMKSGEIEKKQMLREEALQQDF